MTDAIGPEPTSPRDVAATVPTDGPLLFGLDFDGTLSPIVRRPDDAACPPATRRVVTALVDGEWPTVAVVSGRGLDDLRERLGIPGAVYVGNHGLERWEDGERTVHPEAAASRDAVTRVCDRLADRLADVAGIEFERKGLTATVHYRRTPDADVPRVRDAVDDVLADEPSLSHTAGKDIYEVRPAIDWDKGAAFESLRADLGGPPAVYVGDDATDEDVFSVLGDGDVGVKVGDGDTTAGYRLRSPAAVRSFLAALRDARR